MKHVVIVAHPEPGSFNLTLAHAYQAATEGLGHGVVLRDLYRMDFDPCLKADEIPRPDGGAARPDIVAERAVIGDADVFVLVYPLWFNAPPAMLKGYIDRVFGMGFGFGFGAVGNEPRLKGKMLVTLSTSGAPQAWMRETGSWDAVTKLFDEHLASVCGLSMVDHLHFGDITADLTAEAVETCTDRVADAVRRHFSGG